MGVALLTQAVAIALATLSLAALVSEEGPTRAPFRVMADPTVALSVQPQFAIYNSVGF